MLILIQIICTLVILSTHWNTKPPSHESEVRMIDFVNKNMQDRNEEIKIESQTTEIVHEVLLMKTDNNQTNNICNGTRFYVHSMKEETWQRIDSNKTMYIFSAYYVERKKRIFIIGAKPRHKVHFICQLWKSVKEKELLLLSETRGEISAPQEGFGQKYTSTIFSCPLDSSNIPSHVSLVTKECERPKNLLIVQNASKTADYERRFTVCLSPLNFRYGRAYELVEWIELNKILGADYFVIYNYSSAENVKQVIDYYSGRNEVKLVQWRLPMGVNTFPKTNETVEINYFGQTAALNDCLFRNKQFSEFIVNLDVDEFIIPHSRLTFDWSGILKHFAENASVYQFRNTFFRKEWERTKLKFENYELAEKFCLVTLQVFDHEEVIFPAGERSKYIARTADVDVILIHIVPGLKTLTVPVDLGLLHHYRNWENPNDSKGKVTDLTVLQKYGKVLIENVQSVWKGLANVKMDIPLL